MSYCSLDLCGLVAIFLRFTLFPYTTLFRSQLMSVATKIKFQKDAQPSLWYRLEEWKRKFPYGKSFAYHRLWYIRSEEHTSELQSRGHLVCRLLLEKKK